MGQKVSHSQSAQRTPKNTLPPRLYSIFYNRARAAIKEDPALWLNKYFTAAELWAGRLAYRREMVPVRYPILNTRYTMFRDADGEYCLPWPLSARALADHIEGLFYLHTPEMNQLLGMYREPYNPKDKSREGISPRWNRDKWGNKQLLYVFRIDLRVNDPDPH